MTMGDWPAPLLQPDPHTGCLEHSVAYICRCFGSLDTSPEDVTRYRGETRRAEEYLPNERCGVHVERYWHDFSRDHNSGLHKRYWMGPPHRRWVEDHLAAGHIALVQVLRIPTLGHSVVLLGSDTVCVHLMDPLYGFKEEPWEWFLGPGVGSGCHHIKAWYWKEQGDQP